MITLNYLNHPNEVMEIKETLENLSLSFQMQKDPLSDEIYVKEGGRVIKGPQQIQEFMDMLERDAREWCKCVCD